MFASTTELMSTRTSQNACACIALTLCLLLCGAQKAHAQQEVRYPQMLEHGGKRFAAYVNEINGTPTWIIDTDSLDFTLGSSLSLTSESEVETKADAFIDAHKDVFGLDTRQLGEPRILTNGRMWFVRYPQLYKNYQVWMAELVVSVLYDGTLVAVSASLFPQVEVNTTPSLSSSAALQVAFGAAGLQDLKGRVKTDLVIVPLELEASYTFGLAWEVSVYDYDRDPPFSKAYLIDAHTGKILEEYDHIGGATQVPTERRTGAPTASPIILAASAAAVPLFMTDGRKGRARPEAGTEPAATACGYNAARPNGIKGTVSLNYHVTPNNKNDSLETVLSAPFPYAKYSVAGGSYSCTGFADENGAYSASLPAPGTYTVTFTMANDVAYVESTVLAACDTTQSFTLGVNDQSARLDYDWGWGSLGEHGHTAVALNGLYQTRTMHNYYKTSLSFSGLNDARIKIKVENRDRAFVEAVAPLTIETGGKYGRSSEIILHEYGHVVQFAINSRGFNSTIVFDAIREGAADFFAADITGNSLWGGPASSPDHNDGPVPWRELNQTCRWGDDCLEHTDGRAADRYHKGMVLAAAAWAVRTSPGSGAASILMGALKMSSINTETTQQFRDAFTKAAAVAETTVDPDVIESAFTERKIGGPNMPRSLAVICSTGSPRRLQLTWVDNSSLETGYVVERSANNKAWSQIAALAAITSGSGSYKDTGVTCPGSVYYYRVAAYKSFTNPVEVTKTYSETVRYPLAGGSGKAGRSMVSLSDQASGLQADSVAARTETSLTGAYPNPFNPVTTIEFALEKRDPVNLTVYDMLGRSIAVLVDSEMNAGTHSVAFDASHLPSGLYIIRMEASRQHWTKWVSLVK